MSEVSTLQVNFMTASLELPDNRIWFPFRVPRANRKRIFNTIRSESMAKRTLNRKDLRDAYDAAERLKAGEEHDEGEDEVEEDEDEEEQDEAEAEAGDEEEEDEEKPAKKKKAPAKVKAPKAKSRSRTAKVTRMKVVWGVFNNSNQCIATFDYPRRKDAEELRDKLTVEKKNTHFLQPVKEPMEEKKDK
jgi:hypothetical protein